MSSMERCTKMENKLIEYLDGRAKPAERRSVEEHLAACAACRTRVEEFSTLWSVDFRISMTASRDFTCP